MKYCGCSNRILIKIRLLFLWVLRIAAQIYMQDTVSLLLLMSVFWMKLNVHQDKKSQ